VGPGEHSLCIMQSSQQTPPIFVLHRHGFFSTKTGHPADVLEECQAEVVPLRRCSSAMGRHGRHMGSHSERGKELVGLG
jgi:hypothetical protein